jgi:hypothetical protein
MATASSLARPWPGLSSGEGQIQFVRHCVSRDSKENRIASSGMPLKQNIVRFPEQTLTLVRRVSARLPINHFLFRTSAVSLLNCARAIGFVAHLLVVYDSQALLTQNLKYGSILRRYTTSRWPDWQPLYRMV